MKALPHVQVYQGTLQPRLENHWGIKTIKWRKYSRDLWFQQLPESILVKSIIKGKCPHGIQLKGQQTRKRPSSGEGTCRAGVGGEVLCSGSSPGPGWAGCGAVGREQCVDGKNTLSGLWLIPDFLHLLLYFRFGWHFWRLWGFCHYILRRRIKPANNKYR